MIENNKSTLEKGNAAVRKGDYEGFLVHCTQDTEWVFVGDVTLHGKEAVRQWMAENYLEPPQFVEDTLIAEGDFVTVLGTISVKDRNGAWDISSYCDVWRFKNGKIAGLQAFVIKA